jgi:hypothetical protein
LPDVRERNPRTADFCSSDLPARTMLIALDVGFEPRFELAKSPAYSLFHFFSEMVGSDPLKKTWSMESVYYENRAR